MCFYAKEEIGLTSYGVPFYYPHCSIRIRAGLRFTHYRMAALKPTFQPFCAIIESSCRGFCVLVAY